MVVVTRVARWLISYQKAKFGLIWDGLGMEFLVSLRPSGIGICYILWLFGILFPFWYVEPRKIWQTCLSLHLSNVGPEALLTLVA
jgi:hypothetical protein